VALRHGFFSKGNYHHFVNFTGFVVPGLDAPADDAAVSGQVVAALPVHTVVTAALGAVRLENRQHIALETNSPQIFHVFTGAGQWEQQYKPPQTSYFHNQWIKC